MNKPVKVRRLWFLFLCSWLLLGVFAMSTLVPRVGAGLDETFAVIWVLLFSYVPLKFFRCKRCRTSYLAKVMRHGSAKWVIANPFVVNDHCPICGLEVGEKWSTADDSGENDPVFHYGRMMFGTWEDTKLRLYCLRLTTGSKNLTFRTLLGVDEFKLGINRIRGVQMASHDSLMPVFAVPAIRVKYDDGWKPRSFVFVTFARRERLLRVFQECGIPIDAPDELLPRLFPKSKYRSEPGGTQP